MRVLFLEQQPCIRALKIAVGLRSAIPRLELGFAYQGKSLTEWYGAGDETFDRLWRLEGDARPALAAVLEEFQPELVHCHNLPDALTVLATDLVAGRVPVIHDVHDLQSLRQTVYEDGFPEPGDPVDLERRAIEGSDALVTVSAELLAEIRARYRVPGPALVFPNYALERDLPPALSEHQISDPPRLVYQGTLSVNGGHYDLREIFRSPGRRGPVAGRLPEPRRAGVPRAGGPDAARPAAPGGDAARAPELRLRLVRLQRDPEPRASRHRAPEQAVRVPSVRPAGARVPAPSDHACPEGAGAGDRGRVSARAGARAGEAGSREAEAAGRRGAGEAYGGGEYRVRVGVL